MMIFWCLH